MDPTNIIIETLAGYGPVGIMIGSLFLLGRSYGSSIKTKYENFIKLQEVLSVNLSAFVENTNTLTESTNNKVDFLSHSLEKTLEVFIEQTRENKKCYEKLDEDIFFIKNKIYDIEAGLPGSLTKNQVLNLVRLCFDKVSFEVLCWWEKRKEKNHFLENPDYIRARYVEAYNDVCYKWVAQLSIYNYNGSPLSIMDKNHTVDYLYFDIFSVLYDTHRSLANNKEPMFKEITDYINNKKDVLLNEVSVWLLSGSVLNLKKKYPDPSGEFSWLIRNTSNKDYYGTSGC